MSTAPARTPDADLERTLTRLRGKADEFARLSIKSRIALLRAALDGYREVSEEAVRALCEVKGLDPSSNAAGEEWLVGPMFVVRNIRLLIETLENLEAGRPVIDPRCIETRPDGRVVVRAYPSGAIEKAVYGMYRGEVWMEPGVTAKDVLDRAAAHYRLAPEARKGEVALVLGAGNVSSIAPMDVLYKMFVEGKVCVLKMNPVNAAVGPSIERAFAACIDRGYLAVVYGGGDVGGLLVHHSTVDEIHMTGSDKTYDALVWGPPGPEREARKQKGERLLDKPFSSELGNISPWLIAPGDYSEAELAGLAEQLASAVENNASFNCISPKLLVLSSGWHQREAFLTALRTAFRAAAPRRAYYPGAKERWEQIVAAHPHVERIGDPGVGTLPWALVRDLDPEKHDELCFHMEPWCAVLSEVSLPGEHADTAGFLAAAVRFANERVWGTLSVSVIVPKPFERSPAGKAAIDRAIGELRYGSVAINAWAASVYGSVRLPWGGHPSSTPADIQSGVGWVHNSHMLAGIEKAVVRSSLIVRPKLPFFLSHRSKAKLARLLTDLEYKPSVWKLPAVVAAALAG